MTVKNFLHSNIFLKISCLAIFCLSIFLRSQMDIGADTGIYLNLAKKISQGGKYYYHFFESNFPISFYFYYLQYELAQLLHLNQIILSEIVINLLALLSIFWSAKILQKTTINQNKAHYNLMLVSFFLSFFLRPHALQIGEFGTKTSLLLIALFPYLAFSFERKIALTKKELIQRGCLMGLMPCIKPHYLVLILFVELKCFFQKKAASHLDKFVMILVGAIYLFLMLKFTPEFFEFIVPLWPKTYVAYDNLALFIENLWHQLGARIAIFSLIFLIFSRLKFDANNRILALFFFGASTLILLENIGTIDQIVVFYAAATICVVKFTFDLIASKKILFLENKFIICCLAFVPIFDLEILPASIFGLNGVINVWWVLALFYPFFLCKKISLSKALAGFVAVLILLISCLLTFKYFGAFAYIAANLVSLFAVLFFFERRIFSKISATFSPLSVFVICATISCLFYAYVAAIVESVRGNQFTSPNKLSDMVAYYSSISAPKKTDGILMISEWNAHQFPLLNYLEKTDYQKYHMASMRANKGVSGSGKIFETHDLDRVLALSYLMDDVKNQAQNPNVKLMFVNNTPDALDKDKRCLIGALEYYFLDPKFKKIFLQNFHFKNRVIITQNIEPKKAPSFSKEKSVFDKLQPSTTRVLYDFEVYEKIF
ncbi:MAG: hypothetical protein KA100_05690 [Rickettsiales bacterium]|nr:hypothetical protein [Rickettsiales bacterium]